MLINCLSLLLIIPAFLVCVYYWYLAVVAISNLKNEKLFQTEFRNLFAIIIPAHNEEDGLQATIDACLKLDYPTEMYEIVVIADNCSDNTAKIAKDNGVTCLERFDKEKKGKGFALAFAFDHLKQGKHSAYLILDADCQIDLDALKIFDHYLSCGDSVLQSNNIPSNPDENSMTFAVAVGSTIEHDLFYAPKSQLGLAVFLGGTGMVITKKILGQFPWKASSIVEDVDYAVNLLKENIKITFVPEVCVKSETPVDKEQLDIQRTRWASGNLHFGKTEALKLMMNGLLKRNLRLADAGWTFLIISRPLILLELFIAFIIACIGYLLNGSFVAKGLFYLISIVVVMQSLYFLLGILKLGLSFRRISLLIQAPVVIGRLILISLKGLTGKNLKSWNRTPRG